MAHMARLAKPDEVVARVCRFGAFEKPKWFDVVDRKAFPYMNPTFGAVSALIDHNGSAGDKPPSAAIGAWPTDPIRGVRAFRLSRATAGNRAELSDAILPRLPRLLVKRGSAMAAGKRNSFNPIMAGLPANILRPECIRRPLPFAELVSDQVCFRPRIQKGPGLPRGTAGITTKPSLRSPVWLDAVGSRADFAGLFDHAESIPETPNMGKRTTLIACRRVDEATRQADLFIAPPPSQPVQEGLDL